MHFRFRQKVRFKGSALYNLSKVIVKTYQTYLSVVRYQSITKCITMSLKHMFVNRNLNKLFLSTA